IFGIVLVAGAAAGAWFLIAQRIETGVAEWATQRRVEGLAVDYLTAKVDGFPWEWRLTGALPTMARAGPTPWGWRGGSGGAHIRPWAPHDVPLQFPGVHVFGYGPDKATRRLAIAAGRPDGRAVTAPNGKLTLLTLDLGTARLRYSEGDTPPTEVGRLQLTLQ